MIPALPPKQIVKYIPTSVEIYQYDTSPIGSRQPLLLIHGLDDERVRLFHWQRVCKYLTTSENFRKHYKIYLARYNTKASVESMADAFKPIIRELASTQGHPIVVVALSIAGNIIRNAMVDPSVDQSISRVITLGSPLHGSPLFSQEWMQYSLLTRHKWPILSFDKYLAYALYFRHHQNLLTDYYWDNYDQQLPSIGAYKFKFPITVKGVLLPPSNPPLGVNCSQSNEKIIAYAGFLQNQYCNSHKHPRFFALLYSFRRFGNTTIPAFLARQHAVLRALNYEIASIVHNPEKPGSPYALNDGIIPIASGLSLLPDATAKIYNSDKDEIARTSLQINIKKARLFKNIDHLTFTEGASAHSLIDQFSPNEKPRSLFAWLLSDILN